MNRQTQDIWNLLDENHISPEEALDYLWQFDPVTATDTSISAERSAEIGLILDRLASRTKNWVSGLPRQKSTAISSTACSKNRLDESS